MQLKVTIIFVSIWNNSRHFASNLSFISRSWSSRFDSDRNRARSGFVPERGWRAGADRAADDTGDNNMGNRRARLCSRSEFAGSTFGREVVRNHEATIPSNARPDALGRVQPRAWRSQNLRGRLIPAVGAAWSCIWSEIRNDI